MKTTTNIRFIGLVLIAGFFLNSCAPDELLDKYTDGVVLNISTDIFTVPASLQFVDANPDLAEAPDGLNVRIEGPGRDLIYSTDGKRNPQPVDGFLEIALDKEQEISPENPLSLTFIAEAPGYLRTVQNVVLYDTSFQFISVNMIKLDDLPNGVSMQTGTAALDAGSLPSDTAFITPLTPGKQEAAAIRLREGTRPLDGDGNALSGELSVQMLHFDNRSPESLNAFPGGFEATNVLGPDGQAMDPVTFVTAGFLAIDMFVGNREVKQFSQPVEVEVGINPQTVDPETGALVRAGDRIPVWSLDDETGQWAHEGEAVISANSGGQLFATFEITHLSWWNIDYFYSDRCTSRNPVTVTLASNYTAADAPYAIARFVNTQTGGQLGGLRYLRLVDGQQFRLYNIPRDRNIRLQFLSSFSYYCREVIYGAAAFTTVCGGEFTANVRNFTPSNPLTVQARLSGICERAGADVLIKPYALIYYRPADCPYWSYLTSVYNGYFFTNRLQRDRRYDFRVYYGGRRYAFADVPVQSTTITTDDYNLEINLDGDRAYFDFERIVVPEEYCSFLLGG